MLCSDAWLFAEILLKILRYVRNKEKILIHI